MPGKIEFHFDGPIVEDHQITVRVLGQTLIHLQGAIDRAYLDIKYGTIWKYARLQKADYPETEFTVGNPREGGYMLDLWRENGAPIVKRISSALTSVQEVPWKEGQEEAQHLASQVETRLEQLNRGIFKGRTIAEFKDAPNIEDLRRYGDRSIAKEIDQLIAPIRRKLAPEIDGHNSLELTFNFEGRRPTSFEFLQIDAKKFHQVVSSRELGEPLIFSGRLRAIDRGNAFQHPRARLTLADSNRVVTLHIRNEEDYQELAPYMPGLQDVTLFACPILEFNSFEPNSGDIYYVALAV